MSNWKDFGVFVGLGIVFLMIVVLSIFWWVLIWLDL